MAKGQSKAAYMISAVAEQYRSIPKPCVCMSGRDCSAHPAAKATRAFIPMKTSYVSEVILKLTRELGVNLAGVEIILNMREKMEAMQRQVDEFVRTLNTEFASHANVPESLTHNSLVPLIRLPRDSKDTGS